VGLHLHDQIGIVWSPPNSIESDPAGDALVPSVGDFEIKSATQLIHDILQNQAALRKGFDEAVPRISRELLASNLG